MRGMTCFEDGRGVSGDWMGLGLVNEGASC